MSLVLMPCRTIVSFGLPFEPDKPNTMKTLQCHVAAERLPLAAAAVPSLILLLAHILPQGRLAHGSTSTLTASTSPHAPVA